MEASREKEKSGFLPIVLDIKTTMSDGAEEPQEIQMMTEGTLGERNGHFYITYEETEVTGMKGCKTTLKLEEKKIILIRYGEISTKMEFSENEAYRTTYETPYGVFDMMIRTKKIQHRRDGENGFIQLRYVLEISGSKTQNCEMAIRYRICEK